VHGIARIPVCGAIAALLSTLALALGLQDSTIAPALATQDAQAHRNPCHRVRSCPSDHAAYRWRGLLCVSPTSPRRTAAYREIWVYASRVYYCRR
jgi:hypothetical protein